MVGLKVKKKLFLSLPSPPFQGCGGHDVTPEQDVCDKRILTGFFGGGGGGGRRSKSFLLFLSHPPLNKRNQEEENAGKRPQLEKKRERERERSQKVATLFLSPAVQLCQGHVQAKFWQQNQKLERVASRDKMPKHFSPIPYLFIAASNCDCEVDLLLFFFSK